MKRNWEQNEILLGCQKSDGRAQEQLFRQFYGKLLIVAKRYIPDNDTAQEVLQEGFIKIFEHIKNFDGTGSLGGWMSRIIANSAIDHIRKSKKNAILSDTDSDFKFIPDEDENDNLNIQSVKAEEAMKAIEMLSPAYKMVFNLYVMENYSHKEIAELLGISEGTSKSNLAKARMNLQTILKQKFALIDQ